MVMSLLIRYSRIAFYFHFSITFSTLLIHHYAPQHDCTWHNHMCLHLLSHGTCLHFIRPASLIWWTDVLQFTCFISILSNPNVWAPVAQPTMNPHGAWSGTYYSFASDEPYARFLVDHSYLTCLYLPLTPERNREPDTIAYTSFPQFSDLVLVPHLASHSPCPISHHITLPCGPTIFTCYTTPGDDPLPPDCCYGSTWWKLRSVNSDLRW